MAVNEREPLGIAIFIGMLSLAAPANATSSDAATALIAAERAFAADAGRIGITAAFRAHVAPDGILIRPDPGPALFVLAKDADAPGQRLEWWPAIAAIARSGDLGFTTGPYRLSQGGKVMSGHFLTIWERSGDNRWRWYLDHGLPPVTESAVTAPPTDVVVLRSGMIATERFRKVKSPSAAGADAALNAAIVMSGTASIPHRLARDGFLLRLKRGMVAKSDAVREPGENLRVRAALTLGVRVSSAGDLAASYGRLAGNEPGPSHYYVRVWRRDGKVWRLLVDQVN